MPAPRRYVEEVRRAALHLADDGRLSIAELVTATGITERTARAWIARLAEEGVIVRGEDQWTGGPPRKMWRTHNE